jgi:hypothetical protein
LKSKAIKPDPAAAPPLWRIVRGDQVVASFKTEALARDRWFRLSRTRAGEGAKLLRPDGSVDTSMDRS